MLSVRSWSSKDPKELFLHRRINSKTKLKSSNVFEAEHAHSFCRGVIDGRKFGKIAMTSFSVRTSVRPFMYANVTSTRNHITGSSLELIQDYPGGNTPFDTVTSLQHNDRAEKRLRMRQIGSTNRAWDAKCPFRSFDLVLYLYVSLYNSWRCEFWKWDRGDLI